MGLRVRAPQQSLGPSRAEEDGLVTPSATTGIGLGSRPGEAQVLQPVPDTPSRDDPVGVRPMREWAPARWAPPPKELLVEVLRQCLRGLQQLHENDPPFVHLDVKPDNILFVGEPSEGKFTCKLADLGMATRADGHYDVEDGDARYLAGEMLQENFSDLPKADVFSLGASVYELARGWPLPTHGEEWHAIRQGHLQGLDHAGKAFKDLLRQMLQPDPSMRPSAAMLLAHTVLRSSLERELVFERHLNHVLRNQLLHALRRAKRPHRRIGRTYTSGPALQRSSSVPLAADDDEERAERSEGLWVRGEQSARTSSPCPVTEGATRVAANTDHAEPFQEADRFFSLHVDTRASFAHAGTSEEERFLESCTARTSTGAHVFLSVSPPQRALSTTAAGWWEPRETLLASSSPPALPSPPARVDPPSPAEGDLSPPPNRRRRSSSAADTVAVRTADPRSAVRLLSTPQETMEEEEDDASPLDCRGTGAQEESFASGTPARRSVRRPTTPHGGEHGTPQPVCATDPPPRMDSHNAEEGEEDEGGDVLVPAPPTLRPRRAVPIDASVLCRALFHSPADQGEDGEGDPAAELRRSRPVSPVGDELDPMTTPAGSQRARRSAPPTSDPRAAGMMGSHRGLRRGREEEGEDGGEEESGSGWDEERAKRMHARWLANCTPLRKAAKHAAGTSPGRWVRDLAGGGGAPAASPAPMALPPPAMAGVSPPTSTPQRPVEGGGRHSGSPHTPLLRPSQLHVSPYFAPGAAGSQLRRGPFAGGAVVPPQWPPSVLAGREEGQEGEASTFQWHGFNLPTCLRQGTSRESAVSKSSSGADGEKAGHDALSPPRARVDETRGEQVPVPPFIPPALRSKNHPFAPAPSDGEVECDG